MKDQASSTDFTISLNKLSDLKPIPISQSGAWAQIGNKILVIGGRLEGFHGLDNKKGAFGAAQANTSIYVIDITDFSYSEMPIAQNNANYLHFSSSSMQFCQIGNYLYIAGGYGRKNLTDTNSNYTFNRMVEVNVPKMIEETEKGGSGNIDAGITNVAFSPIVQVTGGEMKYYNGKFFLIMGQNYNGEYTMGSGNGTYTESITSFTLNTGSITPIWVNKNQTLHRRDLNVETVFQNNGIKYVAYGGVFTDQGNGYLNPIVIDPTSATNGFTLLQQKQMTNNYASAMVSIFDYYTNTNYHTLIGGIGQYQFHPDTQSWEDGDKGNLLPFVKTITQMKWTNDQLSIAPQLPPQAPELKDFIGANAIFIPNPDLLHSPGIINYNFLSDGSTRIGYLAGGIKATAPSSSPYFPTTNNKDIYEVILTKNVAET